jgi:hypothetical protein
LDFRGIKKVLACDERHFAPSEIRWWLEALGFRDVAIHAAKLAAFSRNDPLTPDAWRLLVLAAKRG